VKVSVNVILSESRPHK